MSDRRLVAEWTFVVSWHDVAADAGLRQRSIPELDVWDFQQVHATRRSGLAPPPAGGLMRAGPFEQFAFAG
eukprot:8185513-Alexandrium_andersonii.AAC.1